MLNKFQVSSFKFQVKNLKGFTLIELLVVITLIAILAVAVLATINPIEQRRKAQDTATKNTAAELTAAEDRYYATYGCYTTDEPAGTTVPGACTSGATPTSGTWVLSTSAATLKLGLLQTSGEVKPSLITRVGTAPYSAIAMVVDVNGEIHASFLPTSGALKSANVSDCAQGCTSCNDSSQTGGAYYCIPDTQD